MPRRAPPPPPEFRHYLKEWRLKRGLTQEELGARVGLSKGEISRCESANRGIKLELQFSFMHALEIRPAQFFMSPDELSADDLVDRAPPEQKQRILRALKALVDGDD
jgi:transcriptional regulator with XRE-family HTH domain